MSALETATEYARQVCGYPPPDTEVVKWLDENCEHGWSCVKNIGGWMASGSVGSNAHVACGWATPADARLWLAQQLGMAGADCPLPPVRQWEWTTIGTVDLANSGDWQLRVWQRDGRGLVHFDVMVATCVVATGSRATYAGARRAAEREARQQWAARNRKR